MYSRAQYAKLLDFSAIGTFVNFDEILDPKESWIARDIDQSHVDQIVKSYTKNPNAYHHGRPWIIIADVTREDFRHPRQISSDYAKYIIAGRHRRAALLKVLKLYFTIYDCMCTSRA